MRTRWLPAGPLPGQPLAQPPLGRRRRTKWETARRPCRPFGGNRNESRRLVSRNSRFVGRRVRGRLRPKGELVPSVGATAAPAGVDWFSKNVISQNQFIFSSRAGGEAAGREAPARFFLVLRFACWAKKVKSEGAFSKGETRLPRHLPFLCRPTSLQCLCGPTADEEEKNCRPPGVLEGCRKPSRAPRGFEGSLSVATDPFRGSGGR